MPRDPEQNARARAERTAGILRAARRRFAADGYVATRVADIAKDVGMAQGLLYHYFPNKEALFEALLADAFARLTAAAEALAAQPDPPAAKIRAALTGLVGAIAADDTFAPTMLLIAQASLADTTPAGARALIARERDRPYAVLADLFAAGQRDATVLAGDPAALATAFWTTVKGLALHKASWGPDFRAPDVEILLRAFLPAPLPSPGGRHDV
ncbi:MAG: TetR/AcrR family transcriptional regulator [Deltaproteobacteria bacterium]|nr:MAG: TetR/AcrR family transcriptional regulator [Deltaproteobacteria bacterium]